MRYENRKEKLLNNATPNIGRIYKQAEPSEKEERLINWLFKNIGGDITFLSEANQDGMKSPDLFWRGVKMDIKHTAGSLNTLQSHITNAMKQTDRGGVILDVSGSSIADEKIIDVTISRLVRTNTYTAYAIILRDGELIAYINAE